MKIVLKQRNTILNKIKKMHKAIGYAALCNLGFTICGSYIEQVWLSLAYSTLLAYSKTT